MRSWALMGINPSARAFRHADGAAHFMAAILIDDGIEQSVGKRLPRIRGQLHATTTVSFRETWPASAAISPRVPAHQACRSQ
jgi:hypothetical protein